MIKTVIFDIDNTLYNFDKADRIAMDAVCAYAQEQLGWEKTEFSVVYENMKKQLFGELGDIGSSHNRLLRFEKILEDHGLPLSPHALNLYHKYWDTLIDVSEISSGAAGTLKTLKEKGIRLGIGSDMTAWIQYKKLEKLELLVYFDFVVTSEEAGLDKPAPMFFDLCLKKAKCEPGECLFIGDNYLKDYRGALAAGMQALWFVPAHLESYAEKFGDSSAARIAALPEILALPGLGLKER